MSGQTQGAEIALGSVNGEGLADSGVAHGDVLVAFTDAAMRTMGTIGTMEAMGSDDGALSRARSALRAAMGDDAFVDTCAIIGAFNVVDRIADATGIPLDDGIRMLSEDVRKELDLGRFASSVNTPGASGSSGSSG